MPDTKIRVEQTCLSLLEDNDENLQDPSDLYAQGYHDALLDVLEAFNISTDRSRFD